MPSARTASASMASAARTGRCIGVSHREKSSMPGGGAPPPESAWPSFAAHTPESHRDRKSTRLNSSHTVISYAVFCLKKKKTTFKITQDKPNDDIHNNLEQNTH